MEVLLRLKVLGQPPEVELQSVAATPMVLLVLVLLKFRAEKPVGLGLRWPVPVLV